MFLPKSARGEAALLARQATIGPDDLNAVAWFGRVHQVIVQYDVHGTGQLAGRCLLGHFLHRDGLVILIDGQAKLCLQGVVLLILNNTKEK